MKKNGTYLKQKAERGEKITILTGYDYPTAQWEDEAGVDVIHVGDSVGTNILGYENEREVTMNDMLHHLKAVARGSKNAYISVDLPYMSYETPEQALDNSKLFIDAGADGIKLEGPIFDVVKYLTEHGIEVWGHLGYNPQLHEKAGYQAKTAHAAAQLVQDSLALQEAGAGFIVYEMVPEEVAKAATEKLSIPTIGIGAGRYTDGQVLVITDILGMGEHAFRHSARYDNFRERGIIAIKRYIDEVSKGIFPTENNARKLDSSELEKLKL